MSADPRFPIGRFTPVASLTPDRRSELIGQIADAPAALRTAVRGLSADQLRTPYRDGGWTVAQVVHHLPDSHMNACVRTRLALTEDVPNVVPYKEAMWADLADATSVAIEPSLQLLEALHARWAVLLRSLAPEQFARTFRHPDRGEMSIDSTVALYAWHGRHHVAHVTSLRERHGW
jgi:uncharacterized damage-inducible protein DinB